MAVTMPGFDLMAYFKSAEGKQRLMEQQPFIAKGMILQGYNQAPFETHEVQVSDEELLAMDDIDGTKHEVWTRRRQRLESRIMFKNKEYEERRRALRQMSNEIREALERDQKLGIKPSPDAVSELNEINERMARLRPMKLVVNLPVDTPQDEISDEEEAEPVHTVFDPEQYRCDICGKLPKADHKNPLAWLNGHKMGSHKKKSA